MGALLCCEQPETAVAAGADGEWSGDGVLKFQTDVEHGAGEFFRATEFADGFDTAAETEGLVVKFHG
jgi:hypothetical protein